MAASIGGGGRAVRPQFGGRSASGCAGGREEVSGGGLDSLQRETGRGAKDWLQWIGGGIPISFKTTGYPTFKGFERFPFRGIGTRSSPFEPEEKRSVTQ